DRHVDLTGALLRALARVRAEGLDPERHPSKRRAVADATVDDDARPPGIHRALSDHVAYQRRLQRAGAVDDEHGAIAGRLQDLLDQSVVLEAAHRADRALELCGTPEGA